MSSVELQFEFEWLKRAINCSKWAISLQVGMRSLKTAGRERERAEGGEIQHRRFLESENDTLQRGGNHFCEVRAQPSSPKSKYKMGKAPALLLVTVQKHI